MNIRKIGLRAAVVFVALLVVGVLYFRYGARPDPLPPESESAALLERGSHPMGVQELTLVDSSRTTRAHGDYPGAEARTLETTIWYPEDLLPRPGRDEDDELPLVIYSHGFMSNRSGGRYLAEHLASLGYIVASMDYPLTQGAAPDGPLIDDVANQPEDVSFLLDRFFEWHDEAGHLFEDSVDDDRVGVFGLSLGGLTSTLAAFHPRVGDRRIEAAVSIAGPTFMLAPRFFEHRDPAFMMVATDTDAIVDFDANAGLITEKAPGTILVRIENGSHVGFADLSGLLRFLDNPDGLGCRAIVQNVDEEGRWWTDIGTPEEGVVDPPGDSPLCEADPLPRVMNPLHQQRLTVLAVTAFFQSRFADDRWDRRGYNDYLTRTFPREFPEISVERGAPASWVR